MARSARRRSGPAADWVYRANRWALDDPTVEETPLSGTYGPAIGLSSGPAGLTGQVLYDSDDVMRYSSVDVGGRYFNVDAAARTPGTSKGALIHGVEGRLCWRPSTWAVGSLVWLGIRIVVADQDADTGQAQLDVDYSLWDNVGGLGTTTIARFANGRQNCFEKRVFEQFNENSTRMDTYFYARFKRRLQKQEGLFLLLETHALSVNLTSMSMYCRTLVTDDSGG